MHHLSKCPRRDFTNLSCYFRCQDLSWVQLRCFELNHILHCLCRLHQFFEFQPFAVVLPGGLLIVLTAARKGSVPPTPSNHRLQRGLQVSNPVLLPRFQSLNVSKSPMAAFATGVPLISTFHRYTRNSAYLYFTPRTAVSNAAHGLSPCISHLTCRPAYAPFTPSNSGQRSLPTYYRGCWHVVSRSFLLKYRHYRPLRQEFTIRKPSSSTRHRCIRVSPIVQYSPLLPLVCLSPNGQVVQPQSGY